MRFEDDTVDAEYSVELTVLHIIVTYTCVENELHLRSDVATY